MKQKIKLIDDWCEAWRWGSVQIMSLFGIACSTIIAAWPVIQWAIDEHIPDNPVARAALAIAALLITCVLPIATRVFKVEASNVDQNVR